MVLVLIAGILIGVAVTLVVYADDEERLRHRIRNTHVDGLRRTERIDSLVTDAIRNMERAIDRVKREL
jgi:hypothetical protein